MVDYTLYSLIAKVGDDDEAGLFSPHVWKTVLDCKYVSRPFFPSPLFALPSGSTDSQRRYLGLPFKTVGKSFAQIPGEFSEQVGRAVQVPTIKCGEEYVNESWVISEYVRGIVGMALQQN